MRRYERVCENREELLSPPLLRVDAPGGFCEHASPAARQEHCLCVWLAGRCKGMQGFASLSVETRTEGDAP